MRARVLPCRSVAFEASDPFEISSVVPIFFVTSEDRRSSDCWGSSSLNLCSGFVIVFGRELCRHKLDSDCCGE